MAKLVLYGRNKEDWRIQIGTKKMYLWGSPPAAQISVLKDEMSKDKFKRLFIRDMNQQIKGYKDYSKNNWKSLRGGRDEKEWKEAVRDFKRVISIGEQLKKDAQKNPFRAFIKLQRLRNRDFGMAENWNNSYDLITADAASSYMERVADKKANKMRAELKKKKPLPKKRATKKKTPTKRKAAPKRRKTVKRKAPAKKKKKVVKRKRRPSPTISATSVNVGTRKRGGDGRMYVCKTYKRGSKRIKRWVRA